MKCIHFFHTSAIFLNIFVGLSHTQAEQQNDDEGTTALPAACKHRLKDKMEEPFPPKLVGANYAARTGASHDTGGDDLGDTSAMCIDGFAAGYPCKNVDLLSMLDNYELNSVLPGSANESLDHWGWRHSSGREFVLVALNRGTSFVEITDPYKPIFLGTLAGMNNGESTMWRDVKVIDHFALIVAELENHGMQIFDLEELLTASPTKPKIFCASTHYSGFGNAHNLFANEDTSFVYAVGSNTCDEGLHIIDMKDPSNPKFSACFGEDGYVHDVQCVVYAGPDVQYTDHEICFCSNEDSVTIVDVTDKSDIQLLSKTSYKKSSYTHQGWLTDDHKYFIFNDELDEFQVMIFRTRTHVMDVRRLSRARYVGFHNGRTGAIDHNLYILRDLVYQAHYRSGLNILKIIDVSTANFEEAGYFDVFPSSDSTAFNGAWSTYPYHSSGAVTVSGIEQGLFVLKYNAKISVEETCRNEASKTFTATNGQVHGCSTIANYRVGICNDERLGEAMSVCPIWCTGICPMLLEITTE